MSHWKESLIAAVLVVLVLSLSPAMAVDYYWDAAYGDWGTAGNWTPSGPPGLSGRAYVGTLHASSQAYLSSDVYTDYLSVENDHGGSNWVWTHGHRLLIYGTTDLTETPGGNVTLYVASGGAVNNFDTNYLNIYGGAELNMDGGLAQIDNHLNVDSASYITGYGTIEFNSGNPVVLSLAGTLRTDHPTESLTLRVIGNGQLDMDGTSGGNSVIDISSGTSSLIVDGQLSDFFSGTMTIGEGNSVDFTQAWSTDGTINFDAGAGTATLSGAAVAVYDRINANSGTGRITAPVIFNAAADVVVAGSLDLRGATTTYHGGSYTGAGTLSQNYDAIVTADTAINVATFNWDGHLAGNSTTINQGVTFTINSDKIDSANPLIDGYDGTVNVNGGTLIVNTAAPWRMEGTMNLNPGAATAIVGGQAMIVGKNAGTAYLNVAAGPANIDSPVTFESTAAVNVAGVLYLRNQTTYAGGNFSGTGTVRQRSNATVTDNTTMGVSRYEWDGGTSLRQFTIDPAKIFTINSDAISYNPATDGYDSTVNVNGGNLYVNTTDPWRMEGTMNLNYTGGNIPKVYGTEMIVRDSAVGEGINVTGGASWIRCPVTFESTARVNVGAGAWVGLYNDTTYKGGSFTGDGQITQYGDMVVEANTTINVASFNWRANVVTPMTTTINPDVAFTINSSLYGNEVNSNVNINGGTLEVNAPNPWMLKGTMNINNATSWGELRGSEMLVGAASTLNISSGRVYAPLTVEGTVNASTYGRLYGTTVFESSASVNIPAGYLVLDGPTTFRGGSYTGAGTLYQYSNAVVEADTTIDVATYDWGNTTTINPGVALTINSTSIQYGAGNYFAGMVNVNSGATLAVNTAEPWELRGMMNLDGGVVTGKGIVNEGAISGYGTIAAAGLINNGTLSADGGTLVINTTDFPDLDGNSAPEAGVLEAIAGSMHVMGNPGGMFAFDSELYVGHARSFRMDNYGLTNSGMIYLQGGTYVSPQFRQGGILNVNTSMSTINSDSEFVSGSTTTLDASLRIVGSATINAGATFTGPGTLLIIAGSLLGGNGNVDVSVVNYGQFGPGGSAGIFTIGGDYQQTPIGSLAIEIGGLAAGAEHDQVAVGGTAILAGTLDLSLIGGFTPDYNDNFEILTAGSANGRFNLITGMEITPTLYLATVYNPNAITVVAAIPGDANFDGSVNDSDLSMLLTGWGTGDEWQEGDFNGNGAVNDSDLSVLLSNWTYPPAAASVAVPEPATLLLLASAGTVLLRRRRRL